MDEKYVDDNVAGSADKVSAEYEKDPSAAGGEEAWAGKVNDQPSDEKEPAYLGEDDLWSHKDVHDSPLDAKEPAYLGEDDLWSHKDVNDNPLDVKELANLGDDWSPGDDKELESAAEDLDNPAYLIDEAALGDQQYE